MLPVYCSRVPFLYDVYLGHHLHSDVEALCVADMSSLVFLRSKAVYHM